MYLTFQYLYYANHESTTMNSFNLIYRFIYITLRWVRFAHVIKRKTIENTRNLTRPIYAYQTSSEVTKWKKKVYLLITTQYLFRPTTNTIWAKLRLQNIRRYGNAIALNTSLCYCCCHRSNDIAMFWIILNVW